MIPSADDTIPPHLVRSMVPSTTRRIRVTDVGGVTVQGRRRRRNDDAWGHRQGRVFVVADGMGGRPAGDAAATASVEALLTGLSENEVDWYATLGSANAAVVDASSISDERCGGAVVVALRIVDDRASVVHLGDARAYRLRGGVAEPLTHDHSLAGALAELGVGRAESGLDARELRAVTGFLGDDSAWREFELRELTVRDGDRVVLCSDGVHQHVDHATWRRARRAEAAGDAAELLVAAALTAGSPDDATATVVDLAIVTDSVTT